MTIDEAVAFFGSQAELARRIKRDPAAVSMWRNRGGVIPIDVQFRLQVISRGRLRADDPDKSPAT